MRLRNGLAFVAMVAGTMACQTTAKVKERGPKPEAQSQQETTDQPRQRIARNAGEACGLDMLAKSRNAVGEPCLTTQEFMQQLDLSQEEMERVAAISDYLVERGTTLAH